MTKDIPTGRTPRSRPGPQPQPGNGAQRAGIAVGVAGFWKSVQDGTLAKRATKAVDDIRTRKWEVPIHVDVDFIKPVYESAKSTAQKFWAAVPDEYKPFVPPAGSFLLGVMGTWVIVGGRVKRERTKKQQLQKQNQILIKERDDLAALNSSLEKMGRGPSDAVYGKTIAELSQAASESAKVAAQLSRLCYIEPLTEGATRQARGRRGDLPLD